MAASSAASSTLRLNRGRIVGMVRLAWAATLLVAPSRVIVAVGGSSDSKATTVARVLGIRHAIQGLVEVAAWPRWRRTGSVVDLAHALTGVALAGTDRRWRRVALTDSALATTFAVAGR